MRRTKKRAAVSLELHFNWLTCKDLVAFEHDKAPRGMIIAANEDSGIDEATQGDSNSVFNIEEEEPGLDNPPGLLDDTIKGCRMRMCTCRKILYADSAGVIASPRNCIITEL